MRCKMLQTYLYNWGGRENVAVSYAHKYEQTTLPAQQGMKLHIAQKLRKPVHFNTSWILNSNTNRNTNPEPPEQEHHGDPPAFVSAHSNMFSTNMNLNCLAHGRPAPQVSSSFAPPPPHHHHETLLSPTVYVVQKMCKSDWHGGWRIISLPNLFCVTLQRTVRRNVTLCSNIWHVPFDSWPLADSQNVRGRLGRSLTHYLIFRSALRKVTQHGSSKCHSMLKRHDIYRLIAGTELIPKMYKDDWHGSWRIIPFPDLFCVRSQSVVRRNVPPC